MNSRQFTHSAGKWFAGGVGLATASYATYVAVTWFNYGKASPAIGDDTDVLLDEFMPQYEVVDRHKVDVAAPAEVTLSAASEIDLENCALIRAVFKGREWLLRSTSQQTVHPQGLLAQTKSLGWGLLANWPGREIVMGCATRPWDPNPTFRTLQPHEFAAFQEPGYVKIVWTLRADPSGNGESVFRTETRAIATDPVARRKFRRYWALLSPGIILIRRAMLPAMKGEAEHRRLKLAA